MKKLLAYLGVAGIIVGAFIPSIWLVMAGLVTFAIAMRRIP